MALVKSYGRRRELEVAERLSVLGLGDADGSGVQTMDVLGYGESGLARHEPLMQVSSPDPDAVPRIAALAKAGLRFRVLLLRKGSAATQLRSREEPAPDDFRGRHAEAADPWVERLAPRMLRWGIPMSSFAVRLSEHDPRQAMLLSRTADGDKTLLVTHYLAGQLGDDCPTEHVAGPDQAIDQYEAHFELLWQTAGSGLTWLVVSDIDGVLAPTAQAPFTAAMAALAGRFAEYSQGAIQAFERARFRGGVLPPWPLVTFCTGRDENYVEARAQQIGVHPDVPLLCEYGAVRMEADPDSGDLRAFENRSVLEDRRLDDLAVAAKLIDEELPRTPQTKRVMVTRNANKSAGETPAVLADAVAAVLKGATPAFVVLREPTHRQPKSELGDRRCVYVTSGGEACDVLPAVADGDDYVPLDKGFAVRALAEELARKWRRPDLELSGSDVLRHTVALGDSEGDLPMLRIIGFPCGPNNAAPRVQEECRRGSGANRVCGYVAETETAEGACEILEFLSGAWWDAAAPNDVGGVGRWRD